MFSGVSGWLPCGSDYDWNILCIPSNVRIITQDSVYCQDGRMSFTGNGHISFTVYTRLMD